MSLAQGNNTLTRPRIEPGSPNPESNTLTTRPVRPQGRCERRSEVFCENSFFGGRGGGRVGVDVNEELKFWEN